MLHTAAELRQLQSRYTASRVFIVGLELGLDESLLVVAAPVNPTFHPAVPFGIRTTPLPLHSQPARWIRVCGLWFLCAVTVKDALERLTTITSLAEGEAPSDLHGLTVETRFERQLAHTAKTVVEDETALLMHGDPTSPTPQGILNVVPIKPAYRPGVAVTLHGHEEVIPFRALSNGVCGCGEPLCAHGFCAACDGLACGDCAPSGVDK